MLNVAAGKAPMQSSVAEGGIPQKAVDGSTSTFFDLSTCSLTEVSQTEDQCSPLSLVEVQRGSAFIVSSASECYWRQQSYVIKNQFVASKTLTSGFGTQNTPIW